MPNANPFAAAADAAATAKATGGPASTTGDRFTITPQDADVRQSIDDFNKARADAKEAKSRQDVAKAVVTGSAKSVYFNMFASDGVKPDKSLTFMGHQSSVKLVVKDSGGDERFYISDEQLYIIKQLLGDDVVEDVLVDHMRYTFEPSILAKEGVMTRLGTCIQEMVAEGILSEADGAGLLGAKPVRTVKKGTLAKLGSLCKDAPDKMQEVFDALGTTVGAHIR